jgi:hypothetical protein
MFPPKVLDHFGQFPAKGLHQVRASLVKVLDEVRLTRVQVLYHVRHLETPAVELVISGAAAHRLNLVLRLISRL